MAMYGQPGYGHPQQQPMMGGPAYVPVQPMMMAPVQPGYGQPMQPAGYYPPQQQQGGVSQQDVQQLKEQLNKLQADNAAMKESMGYQEMAKKLDSVSGIYIRQNFDIMEMLTGCDFPNKYDVFAMENGVKKGKALFRFKDKTGWCMRNCINASARPMSMVCDNLQQGTNENETCLKIERPCKCTFMCFNRQEMQVQWCEKGQQKYLGKIVDPWDCMHYSFKIEDETGAHIYTVKANCCQLGFYCDFFCCETCQKVEFDITEGSNDITIGKLVKTGKGFCINALNLDYNNFKLEFPQLKNWKHRALLMTCAIFIDFMMFENAKEKAST